MVFQNYALYPHKTVAENMGFALKLRKTPRDEIDARVKRAAEILDLMPYLGRYPRQLSGGQRQRVAMGRAIVRAPQVFLFDEPLSNLDAKLRVQMRAEIKELHQRLKTTTIYVTHDQVEAMTMADRIVVLHDGIVEQIGTPLELYDRPNNLFVAGFIGSPAMNFLAGEITQDGIDLGRDGRLQLQPPAGPSAGSRVTLGVRPEHMRIASGDEGLRIAATVDLVERLGEMGYAHLRLPSGTVVIAEIRGDTGLRTGDLTQVALDPAHLHLFDAGGRRLG
jgi:multiple sugar transport system ATP-binding protein